MKFVSRCLMLLMAAGLFAANSRAQQIEEVPAADWARKNVGFTPVPLGDAANRAFEDKVAGDRQGGWTDQGANSIPNFPTGRQIFGGVPFEIAGGEKQIVALRGQNNEAYPTRATILVNATARALYFLHSAAWLGEVAGTYTVEYSDGTSETIAPRAGRDIFDWWNPSNGAAMRIGWQGKNPEHEPIALALFAWANPHSEKTIARVVAQTPGDAAYLMLAGLTLADQGPFLEQVPPKLYDTSDWFAYEGANVEKRRGTALDVSFLLDAPAGKHGWTTRRGEDFVFADGTEVKFWGINLVASANFPTHAEAERIAEELAQMGVNMTRHHHMDANWANPNIFGNKESTLFLDPEALDRFDYFVAELQKRGIYQYIDLIVNRLAQPQDNIVATDDLTAGFKIEGEFDPRLIALQENFTRQFLGHRNPYTGKRYGEDPAVPLMEIINEDSLFYRSGDAGEFGITSEHYRSVWNQLWNTWLIEKFGDRSTLAQRWTPESGIEPDKIGLRDDEDPTRGTVQSIGNWNNDEWKQYSTARARDNFRFYYDTQMKYFRHMASVVRDMGSQALITGSNHWVSLPIDLYANAQLDYIDRHDYWAHPSGGYGYGEGVSFNATAMAKNAGGGIVKGVAYRRVANYPFIVTEWQTSAPNDYRQEGMLFMGAMCAFQNWSATQFSYSHGLQFGEVLASNFDVYNQPAMMGTWPMSSLIVHRGDIAESPSGQWIKLSDSAVFDPATRINMPSALPFVTKTGVEFTNDARAADDLAAVVTANTRGDDVISNTGQLSFNSKAGYFLVSSPRSQGFTGFSAGQTARFPNFVAAIENSYALVTASALETQPLSRASRVLITAAGNAMNTGMEIDATGSKVLKGGTAPVLVEPIKGRVRLRDLRGDLSNAKVFHLNASGQRVGEVPLTRGDDWLQFEMKAEYKTLHYEVVR